MRLLTGFLIATRVAIVTYALVLTWLVTRKPHGKHRAGLPYRIQLPGGAVLTAPTSVDYQTFTHRADLIRAGGSLVDVSSGGKSFTAAHAISMMTLPAGWSYAYNINSTR